MQLIPPILVPQAQALLQQQGYNPYIIDANGNLDAGGVLSIFFDTVEVRTSLTPTLIFPLNPDGTPPDATMEGLLQSLRPTVTFTGRAGREVIAPYGAAEGTQSWLPALAIGGGIALFVGWLVFGK